MSERLVDKLRKLRDDAPERDRRLAEAHAQAYITATVEKIEDVAVTSAEQGYDFCSVHCDTVMTHGNRIKPEEVYDRTAEALRAQGLAVLWTHDKDRLSGTRKIVYTVSWKDDPGE